MRTIYPPTGRVSDRPRESVGALEPAFMQFVDRAELAGWTRPEIMQAVLAFVSTDEAFRYVRPQARVA